MNRALHRDNVASAEALARDCRRIALPLQGPAGLDPLIARIAQARVVLLGEASHGTSEFYVWRAHMSRRLVEDHGFRFIAVEGDWPDCFAVNRYVKHRPGTPSSARDALRVFQRWPTWMWANWEVVALAEWLRRHNADRPEEQRVGFYGLDVYSLRESLEAVLEYLERVDGQAMAAARAAMRCFEPYLEDVHDYARAAARLVPESCAEEAVDLLVSLRAAALPPEPGDPESAFAADQNALVVRDAEAYYRAMIRGGPWSWNMRDRHMWATLERLLDFHGPASRAIVWEHNTHIGDARFTDMAAAGMVNVGQLAREALGEDQTALVGFSSHRGSVIAGHEWGAPLHRMHVPPAREGSWEDVLHRAGVGDSLLLMDRAAAPHLAEPRGHRAIGVVYDPETERWGNYVPTVMPRRYDALIHLEETRALHPLRLEALEDEEPPDTYPWGV